jgi:hypothetical protein
MDLLQTIKNFATEESAAVTVDWVVLTAAIVGLGLIVMFTVGDGISLFSVAVADNIHGRTPADHTYVGN